MTTQYSVCHSTHLVICYVQARRTFQPDSGAEQDLLVDRRLIDGILGKKRQSRREWRKSGRSCSKYEKLEKINRQLRRDPRLVYLDCRACRISGTRMGRCRTHRCLREAVVCLDSEDCPGSATAIAQQCPREMVHHHLVRHPGVGVLIRCPPVECVRMGRCHCKVR
jgi:hypothetical protein